jgi:hypothetical protein
VNDHFFPFGGPDVETSSNLFEKCSEDILVKVLNRVSGVADRAQFTSVLRKLASNSVDEFCDEDVEIIRNEIDRVKVLLSLKAIPRLEERPVKKNEKHPPVNKTSEEKDIMIYELREMVKKQYSVCFPSVLFIFYSWLYTQRRTRH